MSPIKCVDGQPSQLNSARLTLPAAVPISAEAQSSLCALSVQPRKQEIVVFDPRVEALARLQQGLKPGVEGIVLQIDGDGLEQISAILATRRNIQSLHIIAHGSPGQLLLGRSLVTLDDLQGKGIERWQTAFGRHAKLWLHSCRVAAEETGARFVEHLQALARVPAIAATALVGNGCWLSGAEQVLSASTLRNYKPTLNLAFREDFRDGFGGVNGLVGAFDATTSPDGLQVFVPSTLDDALVVFDRDPATGNLVFNQVFTNNLAGVSGLDGANHVAVSPDGRQVFVAGQDGNTLAIFDRDPTTGNLSFREFFADGLNGVDGLAGAKSISLSPDGLQVFVAGQTDDALVIIDRDPANGNLTFRQALFSSAPDILELNGAHGVSVSPDGLQVFLALEEADILVVFNRDLITGDLAFSQLFEDNIAGVDGLAGARDVSISPDGLQVFVAGTDDNALAVFDRDPLTGNLTFNQVFEDNIAGVDGLAEARSVSISPDGFQVYVTGIGDDALVVFDRNPLSGTLTFAEIFRDGIAGVEGLTDAFGSGVSPDGLQVFVAGTNDNALAVFDRRIPEINLVGSATAMTIASGDTTPSSAEGSDFGTVAIEGPTSITREFTIQNSGTGTLRLLGTPAVTVTGSTAFTIATQPATTVDSGSQTTFAVQFDPDSAGEQTAAVSIANNDGDESLYTFQIRGIGAATEEENVAEAQRYKIVVEGSTEQAQMLVAVLGNDDVLPLISTVGNVSGIPEGLSNELLTPQSGVSIPDDAIFQLRSPNHSQMLDLTVEGNISSETFALAGKGIRFIVTRVEEVDISPSLLANSNLPFSSAPIEGLDLANFASASGNITVQVAATLYREAAFDNIVGFYLADRATGDVIDPLTGAVQATLAGASSTYRQAVRENALVQGQVGNNQVGDLTATFILNADLGLSNYLLLPFLDAKGDGDLNSLYVPSISVNADGADHIQLLGDNRFGFEDLFGGGDNDFDDMVLEVRNLAIV